jgi:dienelactone hydrolase
MRAPQVKNVACTSCCLAIVGLIGISGCGSVFPVWPPNFFDEPPAELGSFTPREYRVDVPEGADGGPHGITMFVPDGAEGPLPAFVWVTGSNVQAYYHQSFHETMASWGYAVIVPDGRELTFTDFIYLRRIVDLAKQALDIGLAGDLGVTIDETKIGVGGYSIGGTMAAFMGAEDKRVDAIVMWAPSDSPFWAGIDPAETLPNVTQPSYFLLAEFDHVEPPGDFPAYMKSVMTQSEITEYIIPQGLHLYFQQPTGADGPLDPESNLTRFEQQGIAIERTRAYLDETLGIDRD